MKYMAFFLFVLVFASPVYADKPTSIKVAGYKVDRVRALFDGIVKIDGVEASFEQRAIGDLNTEAFSGGQRYDITEIGLHPFILAVANDGFDDYQLLPIYPVRVFRHKSIFIRTDRGIKKPQDLKGKTIATAGFSSTSLTWIRGILENEYGVKPSDIHWVISQQDSSAVAVGKVSKNESLVPRGLDVKLGPEGMSESDLLAEGLVDAVFHAAEPKAYIDGHPKVARLFTDSVAVEQEYYKKTGIFPIMHAVAVKRSLLKKHPRLAQRIYDAYSESKLYDFKSMDLGWAFNSVPWYPQALEQTRNTMGNDFWPYGVERNKKALEALLEYSYHQGMSKKQLSIDDLFGEYQELVFSPSK
ncbi:ABC transporter substrate-binding protein [Agaribacterium sp. ZY112]|uniref:ABC transporter substrate-binding protein n=1 Tax=Agaribacterium sp. ZY112 TaxID=3233574 RepID=UPI0035258C52